MLNKKPELRTVNVMRYVTPLREGGSLPAIVEADDGFLYALKFRGAGQGIKALIAELIGGELARALGLKIPELVFAYVDPAFGRTEPDEEIQDLLRASEGLNIGLHYLSSAITFDSNVMTIDPVIASRIVWLDSLITNVDRTARNTNMLIWQKELWLIDHGASLYFHHAWSDWAEAALRPFAQIRDHVLLPAASELQQADSFGKEVITPQTIRHILAALPDEWLTTAQPDAPAEQTREVYEQFLTTRLRHSEIFVKAATDAR